MKCSLGILKRSFFLEEISSLSYSIVFLYFFALIIEEGFLISPSAFKWVYLSFSPLFFARQWHPTPVLLPGKFQGWRSLVGFSPWGREESDTTERLHFHFSLSCIGEGNGNPLQCSCLENPRDGGVWWAAVYGVAQSWTRLKRLSSSSSSVVNVQFIVLGWFKV